MVKEKRDDRFIDDGSNYVFEKVPSAEDFAAARALLADLDAELQARRLQQEIDDIQPAPNQEENTDASDAQ